jgi:VanZ family protein
MLSFCIILWVCAFVVSHFPLEKLPEMPTSDKTLHFAGFFILGAVLLLTLRIYRKARRRRIAFTAISTIVYAAMDEITQPLVNRHADMADFAVDVAGVVAAIVVCESVLRLIGLSGGTSEESSRDSTPGC